MEQHLLKGEDLAAKGELLSRLQSIIVDLWLVQQDEITEGATWSRLGADSLDRIEISLAIEEAFRVDIPHQVGEKLNTVGETIDYLSSFIASRTNSLNSQNTAVRP